MNILIISENFSKGGLETHINTYYEALKGQHKLFFMFSRYEKSKYLQGANINTGLNLSKQSTTKEVLADVDAIVNAIIANNIDVVHVHPFFSIFPAIFACNKTNTPLVYTVHGRSSLNFFNTANISTFYEFALENVFSRIFCVSTQTVDWLKDYKAQNVCYLPNVVDETVYTQAKVENNKKWALVSRLDEDKFPEIAKFLKTLAHLDIDRLDIFGDGSQMEELQELAKSPDIKCKINFLGYCDNVNEKLSDSYAGVIGQGRVALEALTKNYPTLLIGYNKIIGLVDKEVYNKIKSINFIPGVLPEIDVSELGLQIDSVNSGNIEKYQLRNDVIKDFGLNLINGYVEELKASSPCTVAKLDLILHELERDLYIDEPFYFSGRIFTLLSTHFGAYTHNVELKKSINLYGEIFKKHQEQISADQNIVNQLSYEIYLLSSKVGEQADMLKNQSNLLEEQRKTIQQQYQMLNEQQRNIERLNDIGFVYTLKRDLKKIKQILFKKH